MTSQNVSGDPFDLGGDDDGFLDYFLSLGDEGTEELGGSLGIASPDLVQGASQKKDGVPQLRDARSASSEELSPAWLSRTVGGQGSSERKRQAPLNPVQAENPSWPMFGQSANLAKDVAARPNAPNPYGLVSSGMGLRMGAVPSVADPGVMAAGANHSEELAQAERRQKRLARNRESARQSRRRKKQYLELLEEKVAQLTDEIDALRRMHIESADKALSDLHDNRVRQLAQAVSKTEKLNEEQLSALDRALREVQNKFSVSCDERLAVMRFQFEELHSLALPVYSQLLTWILLQPDQFFRSRRTNSSERASANKIGERMMASGITTCGPDADLWPLLCHELSLTYEQEEKLRQFQKRIVEDSALRKDRQNMGLVAETLKRLEEAVASTALSTSKAMADMYEILSPVQQVRFLDWLRRNRERLAQSNLAQLNPELGDPEVMRILSSKDDEVELSEVLSILDRITPEDEAAAASRLMNGLVSNTNPDAEALRQVTQAAKDAVQRNQEAAH
eukprot:scaffold1833_cov255-Pinguiococcus_pyrenoidosus.AAC.7